MPMYTCMSTAKAVIKTVSFRYNGTTDDLGSLEVVSLADKTYANDSAKPLWGVENTSMLLKDGGPLWGLVSPSAAKTLNISTVRKESLYLPGRDPVMGWQNVPAADFASIALDMAYKTGSASRGVIDYSGQSNLAMFRKWQQLSRTPESSAKILNLIWTDIAANMVVGTKGLEGRNQETTTSKTKRDGQGAPPQKINKMPPITNYTRRVRYHYAYGIPAFLALVLAVAALASTLFFMLLSGAKPATIRTVLQHTSAGRFLTSQSQSQAHAVFSPHARMTGAFSSHTAYEPSSSYDDVVYSNAPTQVWARGVGKERFTLGAEGWTKNVERVPAASMADGLGFEEKSGAEVSYAPVPNPGEY